MAYVFSNNASSILMASVSPTDTTIIVHGDHAELFPVPTDGDRAMIVLEDRALAKLEICELLSRNGATLTVSRAKEGTTAQSFTVANTVVAHRWTAGVLTYLVAEIGDFNKRYLGSSATPPTVDRDGAELQVGALYFDLVEQEMFVYTDTGWQTFGGAGYDGGFSLPPGGAAGECLLLDSSLDVVWGVPIDTVARTNAGTALAAANARVLKVGDTMTGPLVIDSGVANQTLLTVDGIALFTEQMQLGNANSGWEFDPNAAGTADDEIKLKLNSVYMALVDADGWHLFSGDAVAAYVENPTALSTQALLSYEADTTTVPPLAGAEGDNFVIIVKDGASVVFKDEDDLVLFEIDETGPGYYSGAQDFTASATKTLAHGLGRVPFFISVQAKLKTGQSDAGYSDSDGYLDLCSNADNGSRGFQARCDATNIRFACGAEGPRVITKTFGDITLDWTKWDFFVRAI